MYRGDRLPADVHGNVFVAEPTANVVSRFIVADDGTTLRARKAYQRAEFLSSTDERFRPVYLSNAPDGTLYVVDIYRGIIQHHAYITEYLRDQITSRALEQPIGLGRIYRVVHDSTVRDRTTLPAKAPSSQLAGLLSHPNGWWRDTAQRLLVERGDQSVVPALTTLVETAPDWRTRVHALWTLDGLNGVTTATVAKALADSSRDVRVAAVRVSERWLGEKDHPLQSRVVALGEDQDWAVRQQAVASMGALPPGVRERSIATVLERRALDPIIADTALSGLRGTEATVLTMLLQPEAERTAAREAAITIVAATIAKSGQESAVIELFQSDCRRCTSGLAARRTSPRSGGCAGGRTNARATNAGTFGERRDDAVSDVSRWARRPRRRVRVSTSARLAVGRSIQCSCSPVDA